jgi:hypothetical protein
LARESRAWLLFSAFDLAEPLWAYAEVLCNFSSLQLPLFTKPAHSRPQPVCHDPSSSAQLPVITICIDFNLQLESFKIGETGEKPPPRDFVVPYPRTRTF